jgi:hypothetical protein
VIQNLKEFISKNISGAKVLMLFILTNIAYALMLVITIPKTMAFSNGMKLLDMMPLGYNLEYAKALFNQLGTEGRAIYLFQQIPVDMIYPFLFGVSYCLTMGYFLKKLNKFDSALFYLCLLAPIAGTSDYIENFGIIVMLNSFPDISQTLVSTTSAFSMIKSMSTTIYFIALIIILIVLGINTLRIKLSRK